MGSFQNGAWWTFCAGCFSCFLTGATYTFGSWSPALKEVFSYPQERVGHLSLAKDVGNFIVMDAGWLTGRGGAHTTMVVGSLGLTLSCVSIWLALTAGGGGHVPFPVMLLVFWALGHSFGYLDNAGISTSVRNFPKRKGNAVGLMKALEGITAAVLSTVFYTMFHVRGDADLANFPLLLAGAALLVGIFATPIVMLTNEPAMEPDRIVSKKFSVLTLALLAYILFCAVVGYTKAYNIATMAVAVCGLFGLFALVLPVGSSLADSYHQHCTVGERTRSTSRPNLSCCEMLRTLDFYLLWLSMIILQGGGIMFTNNLGQIVVAASRDPDASAGFLVTVFSVFNSSGRVFVGFGSEAVRGRLQRPWFLVMSAFVMTACMLLAAFLGSPAMAPVAAGMGLSLGGTFALQAVLVEELFGPQDMPLKYSCCFTAACLGSLVFSDLLAGRVYDAEARRQGQQLCLGDSCFGATFYTAAAHCALAFLCCAVLALRSRSTYELVNASVLVELWPPARTET